MSIPNESGAVPVIAGELLGTHGPASTFTPIKVWDVQLNVGGVLDARVPEGDTALVIVRDGQVTVNKQSAKAVELLHFKRESEAIQMQAETASQVLVLTGKPLNEPVYGQGPFVMNSREEIQEAMADYQAGKMGTFT